MGIDGRSAWLAGRWLGPAAGNESSVPADHGCRLQDQQGSILSSPIHCRGEQRKERSVGLVEECPVDLALQHHDLMAQSQDLSVTGIAAGKQPAESPQDEPSEDGRSVTPGGYGPPTGIGEAWEQRAQSTWHPRAREWPSRSATTFGGTPAAMCRVAGVWRRSWSRIAGTGARRTMRSKVWDCLSGDWQFR